MKNSIELTANTGEGSLNAICDFPQEELPFKTGIDPMIEKFCVTENKSPPKESSMQANSLIRFKKRRKASKLELDIYNLNIQLLVYLYLFFSSTDLCMPETILVTSSPSSNVAITGLLFFMESINESSIHIGAPVALPWISAHKVGMPAK